MASGLFLMGVIVAGAIAGLIILIASLYREDEEDYYDDTILQNTMTQYSDGYFQGKIVRKIYGTKRVGIIFKPNDIDKYKVKKKKDKIEEQGPIWVYPENIKSFPKGKVSGRRHVEVLLPPTINDFPSEEMKRMYGYLLEDIEKNNSYREEDKILRKRINRQNKFLEQSEGLDIANDTLNLTNEGFKSILKSLGKDDKKGFEFGSSPGSYGSGGN